MNNRHFSYKLKKPNGPIQGTLDEQNKSYYELEKNRSCWLQLGFRTTLEQNGGYKEYSG